MTLIHVPRPPKRARNPERPVSSLLKMQIEQLHSAEKRLPLRDRSEIYINAIKTEGEAAKYIREVTEAIHGAHEDAARQRTKRAPSRKRGIEIAAAADARPAGKRTSGPTRKKSKGKRKGKK